MDSRFREAAAAFQRGDLEAALAIAKSHASTAPEWEHLLGLIECRRGNPDAGVPHLRAASDAQPENAGFRLMLARALVDSRRAAEVLALPVPDGTPSPTNLALWHVRAEAADKLDDASARAAAWQSIAAMAPQDHRAWLNLGRSLLGVDAFEEAAEAYRKSLAIASHDVDALTELALLHERMNRIPHMTELLESSAAAGIGKDRLAFAWASLEQRRGNWEEARRLLMLPGADRDPILWYRLRTKVEDALDNCSAAFAAAVAMNRSMPRFEQWRRRGAAHREQLRDLAQAIARWPPKVETLPPVAKSPIFLVGFPRSGTTLLDTFLMGHHEIEVLEELPALPDVAATMGPLRDLPAAPVAKLRVGRERYLNALATALPAGWRGSVIDKFPLNMIAAPLIHYLFPSAPIIFAQRHPCDAVLSGFMQAFTPNLANSNFLDLADAADFYDACMTVWTEACERLPLNVHTVAYEELVFDPEATLRPVIHHLRLEWDESILDHRSTAVNRGPIPNTSYDQVTEPLSAAPVLRWRRYEEHLAPVLPILTPWAERLGYET